MKCPLIKTSGWLRNGHMHPTVWLPTHRRRAALRLWRRTPAIQPACLPACLIPCTMFNRPYAAAGTLRVCGGTHQPACLPAFVPTLFESLSPQICCRAAPCLWRRTPAPARQWPLSTPLHWPPSTAHALCTPGGPLACLLLAADPGVMAGYCQAPLRDCAMAWGQPLLVGGQTTGALTCLLACKPRCNCCSSAAPQPHQDHLQPEVPRLWRTV